MGLSDYHKKRKFSKTPEPKHTPSHKGKGGPKLHFCIQKHAASHLHYDFRLECDGVLLSWAVPKEPSKDPSVKRLAIRVEDHPLSYRLFEGVIPEGNYGAGTVKLWDEGTYVIEGAATKKEAEKTVRAGLRKGHLNFILEGKRLKGPFSLIRFKEDKQWLFFKRKASA